MKTFAGLLIVLSIIGVGVFGYAAMNMKHDANVLCLASILNPVGCLTSSNTFNLSFFHISVFNSLTTAIFLLGLVICFALLILRNGLLASKFAAIRHALGPSPKISKYSKQLNHWFKLLQKRDPRI